MAKQTTLTPDQLSWVCDRSSFAFKTTEELGALTDIIGQQRALASIEFGLSITNSNYNVFVLGEGGTGKHTTVKNIIERKARSEAVPDDWCYIFNFAEPDVPSAINLPPGKGSELAAEMDKLVTSLKRDIPKVFESKDYDRHRDEILEGQQERTRSLFSRLEQLSEEKGHMLNKTAAGLSLVPAKDGKPIGEQGLDKLSRAERDAMEQNLKFLQDKLGDAIREARKVDKETKERVTALDREVVQYVVMPQINELLDKFKGFAAVVDFIGKVSEDILGNIEDFRPREDMSFALGPIKLQAPERTPAFERYKVNLIVNNKETDGAPVVYESNPTYYNLFGRIEYKVQMGVATTDFSMIKGGAAHRANGGYLIVNAMDILRNIFVYDSLKRMIKNKEIKIEDAWEQYRMVSTTALKPAPVPVNIKLIIVGEPMIYYLLYNMDREYKKLFKVKADFDNMMEKTDENIEKYAYFVAARCKEEGLLPFDPEAVAGVVEYGCRLAGDKAKLSARFNDIKNLVIEASHFAGVEGATVVSDAHVDKARAERKYRHSKLDDKYREYITADTIMVDTEGSVVGQVNGIAVLNAGDYAFGKPSRITARTFMGDKGIFNIEREVKMSGRIHNKGLMILTNFLGDRFGQSFPITLSASLCFEQLYDEIDGDSATCTEYYALMSSLSGCALDQGIAVTGSMNQRGEVQPIGGVNEKIEGFFGVCKDMGLTGSQGVIIPARNVKNLMLSREVVDAVKEGRFSIYPINDVDEGLGILTGSQVGTRLPGGVFPDGTVNALASKRLLKLASGLKAFGKPKPKKKVLGDSSRKADDKKPDKK
jgi:lon-related putative ATP-dependent protease